MGSGEYAEKNGTKLTEAGPTAFSYAINVWFRENLLRSDSYHGRRNIKTRDNLEGRRGHNKLSLPGPIWLVTTKESEALKKNLRNFEVRKKRANERKLIVITNDNATPST